MLIALSVAIISIGAILFFSRRLLSYLRHFQEFDYRTHLRSFWRSRSAEKAGRVKSTQSR